MLRLRVGHVFGFGGNTCEQMRMRAEPVQTGLVLCALKAAKRERESRRPRNARLPVEKGFQPESIGTLLEGSARCCGVDDGFFRLIAMLTGQAAPLAPELMELHAGELPTDREGVAVAGFLHTGEAGAAEGTGQFRRHTLPSAMRGERVPFAL